MITPSYHVDILYVYTCIVQELFIEEENGISCVIMGMYSHADVFTPPLSSSEDTRILNAQV